MPRSAASTHKANPEILNDAEIQRLADRLAAVLTADHVSAADNVSLMTLLFDQLLRQRTNAMDFSFVIDTVKRSLFLPTDAATEAQQRFQSEAYKNRSKLLLFPYERKERT